MNRKRGKRRIFGLANPSIRSVYSTESRLARYAGQDGRCYPAVATLALEIGVRKRQAQKYITELERLELIRRVSRFSGRAQTSNAFEFLWHPLLEEGVNNRSGEG